MDIGQQILSGSSPPTTNHDQINLNSFNSLNHSTNNLNNLNTTTNNSNIADGDDEQHYRPPTEPIKRIYSSKSKTIHTESNISSSSIKNDSSSSSHQTTGLKSNQTIVMNSGGVFPMNKPNYFFPPFPSPNGNAFTIPPFPMGSLSNSLQHVNQQVDVLNQSGYSTSSSSPNSAHIIPQIDLDKSNIDSVPIKKRQKKSTTCQDISNQIVTTDEENIPSPSSEKKRQRKDSDDMDKQKERKEKRLIRNRQSAQASRERKKLYIQTLEEKVSNLEDRVKLLEEENALLRRQVI